MSTENKKQPLDVLPSSGAHPVFPPAPLAPATSADLEAAVADASRTEALQEKVVNVLRTCYDPEIPVNIHELGLIYGIEISPAASVTVRMTLTSPMCPVAGSLPPEVEAKIRAVPGISSAKVEIVWDPPWTPDRMTEAAKLQLGMF